MTETAYYVHIVVVLQPLRWCCVDCAIHHERDVREEQKYIYVARTSNNRVISSGDLYWCLLPRCESLRTCRSGFPIATVALRFPGLTVGYTSASQPVGREMFRDILNIFWKKLLVDTNCIFFRKRYELRKPKMYYCRIPPIFNPGLLLWVPQTQGKCGDHVLHT